MAIHASPSRRCIDVALFTALFDVSMTATLFDSDTLIDASSPHERQDRSSDASEANDTRSVDAFAIGFISHRRNIVGLCLKFRVDHIEHTLHLGVPRAIDLIKTLALWTAAIDAAAKIHGRDRVDERTDEAAPRLPALRSPVTLTLDTNEIGATSPSSLVVSVEDRSLRGTDRLCAPDGDQLSIDFTLRSGARVSARLSYRMAVALREEIRESIDVLENLWHVRATAQ